MKFISPSARRLAPLAPFAFLVLAGCSSTPLRHSTAEFVSPATWVADGHTFVNPQALTSNPAPAYPLALRRGSIEGLVNVDCVIDSSGHVLNASVANSSDQAFNYATLKTVNGWTFQPATRDGVAVDMHVWLPVDYVMRP